MEQAADLVTVPRKEISIILEADREGLLVALAEKYRTFSADVSKPGGRDEIRSFAALIRSVKVKLDNLGKDLTEDWRKKTGQVNAERKVLREKLDAAAETVRAPLTAFENAEEARVLDHETACTELELAGKDALANWAKTPAAKMRAKLVEITTTAETRDWQEFAQRASDLYAVAKDQITSAINMREQADKDAAELAELRAQKAERDRRETEEAQRRRDEQIAQEAADRARREAEATAQRERDAEEARRAELNAAAAREQQRQADEIARLERQQAEAAERAEADRVQRHRMALTAISSRARAALNAGSSHMIRHVAQLFEGMDEIERDFEEFADEAQALITDGRSQIAERIKVVEQQEAEQAERDRLAEEERQEQERGRVLEAERQRVAAERAQQQEIARQQQAEVEALRESAEHRRGIITEATETLIAAVKLSDAQAKAVIAAIDKGKVSHVSIAF